MPDKHAFLSPSAAHRWLQCTPCAAIESTLPDSSSEFAKEGTIAHAIGEYLLKYRVGIPTDRDIEDILREAEREGYDSKDMMRTVREGYADRVIEVYEEMRNVDRNTIINVETTVSVSEYAQDCWGTSDCFIINENVLHVFDYKHGKGVQVSARNNPQMMIYALGAYLLMGFMFNIKTVNMSIYQPRINNYSTATMSIGNLKSWAEEVLRPAAIKARSGAGEVHPGTWCKFCKAAPRCRALFHFSKDLAQNSFEPTLMTEKELANALDMMPIVKAWAKSVEEFTLKELIEGRTIPGYKLVEGISRSTITDQDGAAEAIRAMGFPDNEIYKPQELKGITELKKLVGVAKFRTLAPFITKPQGRPCAVPEDDPRPAINNNTEAEKAFEGIETNF